jgi:hypothetical protein
MMDIIPGFVFLIPSPIFPLINHEKPMALVLDLFINGAYGGIIPTSSGGFIPET